jgi:chromate transporter
MVNLATYIGSSQGGILGAAVATFAVVLPAFLIIVLLTALLRNIMKYRGVKAVLSGLGACVMGIVFTTGLSMVWGGVAPTESGMDWRAVAVTVILGAVMLGFKPITKKKLSPILFIVISAAVGIVAYGL